MGQKELDKAKDVLLQYEEELLQPSARTLRFLARSLERAGMPVPFDVPDFQPVRLYLCLWCSGCAGYCVCRLCVCVCVCVCVGLYAVIKFSNYVCV